MTKVFHTKSTDLIKSASRAGKVMQVMGLQAKKTNKIKILIKLTKEVLTLRERKYMRIEASSERSMKGCQVSR